MRYGCDGRAWIEVEGRVLAPIKAKQKYRADHVTRLKIGSKAVCLILEPVDLYVACCRLYSNGEPLVRLGRIAQAMALGCTHFYENAQTCHIDAKSNGMQTLKLFFSVQLTIFVSCHAC